jgi:hypothetical protein
LTVSEPDAAALIQSNQIKSSFYPKIKKWRLVKRENSRSYSMRTKPGKKRNASKENHGEQSITYTVSQIKE